jgi:hypothetical protein
MGPSILERIHATIAFEKAKARAVAWLTAWDSQGTHRTGTTGDGAGALWGVYSSGIPALRSPTKYVASNRARIFGPPNGPTARKRAMLE